MFQTEIPVCYVGRPASPQFSAAHHVLIGLARIGWMSYRYRFAPKKETASREREAVGLLAHSHLSATQLAAGIGTAD
jgi:hypothetical protein